VQVNIPEILKEVTLAHKLYEAALDANDVTVLNDLFWKSPLTLRFGVNENLYSYDAITSFRSARIPPGPRVVLRCVITSFGTSFATINLEFRRNGSNGRQSQTWVKMNGQWYVVAAHISNILC